MRSYNPINASLSYSWRQIPQVVVFVEAFHHNTLHSKQASEEAKCQRDRVMREAVEGAIRLEGTA